MKSVDLLCWYFDTVDKLWLLQSYIFFLFLLCTFTNFYICNTRSIWRILSFIHDSIYELRLMQNEEYDKIRFWSILVNDHIEMNIVITTSIICQRIYLKFEQSSYPAMLNIAESVPPPEQVPSNSGNSIAIQYNRPTRHWPSSVDSWNSQNLIQTEYRNWAELEPIPGIPESDGIPCNSGTEFRNRVETELDGIARNSGNSIQFRNCTEFHPVPEFHLIPEFRELLPIRELHGIPGIWWNSVSDE
jgi:hypothetical protein